MKRQIVILGTMDTKSEEFGFVKKLIEQNGLKTLVIDVGVIDPPGLNPDVTRYEVAKTVGKDLNKLIKEVLDKGSTGCYILTTISIRDNRCKPLTLQRRTIHARFFN